MPSQRPETVFCRRGGPTWPPASLPPSRGKVPPKGADEGALLKRRLLSLPVLPLPPKPPLSKGGAAKRRGDSLSQRSFTARFFFFSVGAHTVRPRAAEVRGGTPGPPGNGPMRASGPTKDRTHLRIHRRGGCPHPPAPKCSDLPVGAAHRAARNRPAGGIGPYKRSNAPSDTS